jgi:squalene synthase HpnC
MPDRSKNILQDGLQAGMAVLSSADAKRLGLSQSSAQGGKHWPETIRRAFEPVSDPIEAEAYTRSLTHSHYENFSVVSVLLPKHLKQDFCNVYAFCRIADDLGDEMGDRDQSLDALARFREQLVNCYQTDAKECQSAVFAALRQTIGRHDIPMKPFDDLIRAFEQDQTVLRYETFDRVIDYCTRSADPVGRIVLYLCGYRDAERQKLSDKICTALQLINFWQDVRRDILERDRIYLPAEDMQRHGVSERQLREGRITEGYRELIRFEVERTERLFDGGEALLPLLAPVYRKQIALFAKGGRAICTAIRRQRFDTLTRRPRLSKWQKARLISGTLLGYLTANALPGKKRGHA